MIAEGEADAGPAARDTATAAGVARFLRQRVEFGENSLLLAEAGTREVLDSLARFRSRPAGAAPAPMASPTSDNDLSLPGTLAEVEEVCAGCVRCGLSKTRTQTVFADGNPDARVMVVGEAPGASEDATGQPFVGAAGKLLDLLLRTVDLSRRESVYICNVIKCRPPDNRNPEKAEIESCAPYLRRQIELVRPEVILAVGTFSGQLLTGRGDTLGRLRGQVFRYEGIPLVVTYHPAALLRNSGWTRPTWEDLQLLRRILDGEDVPT
ncbi:MAG: uracil-DNA glycosylase [Gemmatimonadales bacterium]|nr:MAG: uracil-DNA glycosylase [Gemmatimonadales bacterium]